MSGEQNLAKFRAWVLSVLGLLSADPSHQIEYLVTSEVEAEELLLQFDDVLNVFRARLQNDTVTSVEFDYLTQVAKYVDDVALHYNSLGNPVAIRNADEWRELRTVARLAMTKLQESWALNH